ncbi:T9SS C-terminal target domain-containing protein [Flavobacterium arcticum]|uniref:T9SS C-terminal target domain-containing protein n=1 Tax=Flavobacterium arcticum TaxID=1784713 RepID=A0A345HEL4_9FLAO|nr:T9SS type A sorting domain-containing protein [Flavobacterium arcticum]AXG75024.1 T9SS C-terminal target domain-containing protein [Flavobacterium arcticum]KAF2506576.1 T9SS type A sorting domain-containing protein [Flavobacterium arcticum]
MRKLITILAITITMGAFAQRPCVNGSFEYVWGIYQDSEAFNDSQFNFTYESGVESVDCNYDVISDDNSGIDVLFSEVEYNNFNTKVSVVDDGLEPNLFAESVSIPRVYEGNQAIKLNDSLNNSSVTSMGFAFEVTRPVISFKYLLVANNPVGVSSGNLPHFIVNLFDDSNILLDTFCVIIEVNDPDFQSTGTSASDFLYSGWQCLEFGIDTTLTARARLQFIVADDTENVGFHTAYIDNICDEPCCLECPDIITPVGTGMIDEEEAEICIYASNSITGTGSAIYHAGTEVVLEDGFEALYGTIDRFYIEGCSGNFAARPANPNNEDKVENNLEEINNSLDKGFIVYPNPVLNELNIVTVQDVVITKVSLYAIDGKLILQAMPNGSAKTNTIDISSVSKGIYVLSVETNDGKVTSTKVLKN